MSDHDYPSRHAIPVMTAEEYFVWEQTQEPRFEFIDGKVFQAPLVSFDHSTISTNILCLFFECVDQSRFELNTCQLRLQINPTHYVYPQLSIVRGKSAFSDPGKYNLVNPFFVVEVASPSSGDHYRTDKLDYYYDVPSIQACLIVDRHRLCAELHSRADYGWQQQVFTSLDDVLPLPMLDCELPLDQVYRGIAGE